MVSLSLKFAAQLWAGPLLRKHEQDCSSGLMPADEMIVLVQLTQKLHFVHQLHYLLCHNNLTKDGVSPEI